MDNRDEHILDNVTKISALDSAGMLELVRGFGALLNEAIVWANRAQLPGPKAFRNAIVLGMGGSAIGGDLVKTLMGKQFSVPFQVVRGYDLPRFVDSGTLVIASSYSGNTEETLAALTAAIGTRATVVCVTSGGEMRRLAIQHGLPLVELKGGQPPRSALPFSLTALLQVLASADLLPEMEDDLESSVEWLERLGQTFGPATDTSDNLAKMLALQVRGRIPVIYGSYDRLEYIAKRWAAQFSENGKQLAYASALPEMNHNEIAGWKHPGQGITKLIPVLLRDEDDHPRTQARFEITRKILEETVDPVLEFWSVGKSWLERYWSLILLGDFGSVYLAALNEEDPTQIETIESLKKCLGTYPDTSGLGKRED